MPHQGIDAVLILFDKWGGQIGHSTCMQHFNLLPQYKNAALNTCVPYKSFLASFGFLDIVKVQE